MTYGQVLEALRSKIAGKFVDAVGDIGPELK